MVIYRLFLRNARIYLTYWEEDADRWWMSELRALHWIYNLHVSSVLGWNKEKSSYKHASRQKTHIFPSCTWVNMCLLTKHVIHLVLIVWTGVLLFMSFSCTRQMFVGRKVSFSLSTFSPFYWFYWLYWFLTAVLFPRVVKKLTQLDSHLTVYIQWLLWAGFPAFFAESCKILREEMGNWLSLQLTVIINQYVINKALVEKEN